MVETKCALCGNKYAEFPLVERDEVPYAGTEGYCLCENCRVTKQGARIGDKKAQARLAALLAKGQADPSVAPYFADRFGYALAQPPTDKTYQEAQQSIERQQQQNLLHQLMVTSGPDFQGYRITSYCGFISEETVMGLGMFAGMSASATNMTGSESGRFTDKLREASDIVMDRLREAAFRRGANAIVATELDYSLGGMVLVHASGTAVTVVKTPLPDPTPTKVEASTTPPAPPAW
ncbi:MAG: YbjQ family protein [Propionibacteriaceae bacterium]|nr:YbjQ family protein [Propionibacteriaceae bacterium]